MLCEKCKKNPATVHLKQAINGTVTEQHLCQACAEADGFLTDMTWNHGSFGSLFDDMFQDMFHFSAAPEALGTKEGTTRCPVCGMTLEQFKQGGKLGCAACYETFAPYLQPTLKSIHGSNEHKGKIPKKSGGQMMARREMETLKRKLALAIEKEEFEEAAKLRDRIRQLGKEE